MGYLGLFLAAFGAAGSIMARVEDVHRLTAPLRGLARALLGRFTLLTEQDAAVAA